MNSEMTMMAAKIYNKDDDEIEDIDPASEYESDSK